MIVQRLGISSILCGIQVKMSQITDCLSASGKKVSFSLFIVFETGQIIIFTENLFSLDMDTLYVIRVCLVCNFFFFANAFTDYLFPDKSCSSNKVEGREDNLCHTKGIVLNWMV